MSRVKIGIYGGTFSPPHNGHLHSAQIFIKEMKLDKLLIIPAFIPPHKYFGEEASTEQRLEMCRLTFGDIEHAEISDMEIVRGGKSYSYLTLEELSSFDVELYMLIGTDMFLTLDEWKYPEKIFELTNICFIRRENDPNVTLQIAEKRNFYEKQYKNVRIYEIESDVIEISSSELRVMISEKNPLAYEYILPSVVKYIENGGIYR